MRPSADPFVNYRNAANASAANLRNSLEVQQKFKRLRPSAIPFEHTAHHPSLSKAQLCYFDRLQHPFKHEKEPFHDHSGPVTYRTLPRFIRDTESRNFDPRSPNYRGPRRSSIKKGPGQSPRSKSLRHHRPDSDSKVLTKIMADRKFHKRPSARLEPQPPNNNSAFEHNAKTGRMRLAQKHTYLRHGMYTVLPETESQLRNIHKEQVAHTSPCRPPSSIGAAGVDRRSHMLHQKSPRLFVPGFAQNEFFQNSITTNSEISLSASNSHNLQSMKNTGSMSDGVHHTNTMMTGFLRTPSNCIHLDNVPIMRLFCIRVPVTNHTSSCLVHVSEGHLTVASRNIWAEIQSHATLLAPKMTGQIAVQICASFPGQGLVNISYLNEPLVSLVINAVPSDTTGVDSTGQDEPQVGTCTT